MRLPLTTVFAGNLCLCIEYGWLRLPLDMVNFKSGDAHLCAFGAFISILIWSCFRGKVYIYVPLGLKECSE